MLQRKLNVNIQSKGDSKIAVKGCTQLCNLVVLFIAFFCFIFDPHTNLFTSLYMRNVEQYVKKCQVDYNILPGCLHFWSHWTQKSHCGSFTELKRLQRKVKEFILQIDFEETNLLFHIV